MQLTQERVRELFTYNPLDEHLRAKVKRKGSSTNVGDIVGCPNNTGYLRVCIDRKYYTVHKVIWLYATGQLLGTPIDHIDGNRSNNRLENLRKVTKQENERNKTVRRDNKLGILGVEQRKSGRFVAYITPNRKKLCLGTYDTLEEAAEARHQANIRYGFHENHGRINRS